MDGCYDNRMNGLIALTSRRFTAGVAPDLGGSLLYFATAREPIVDFVRPTSARSLTDGNVRATAGYPLVPYSNRIGDGRFRFDGREVALERNSDVSSHPIHGLGWLARWRVEAAAADRVVLVLEHAPSGAQDAAWPWAFAATQTFELDDRRLSWRIDLTNRDPHPMPAGLGMHPFFPKSPRMEVRFEAAQVWRNDERMLPMSRTDVPDEWNFQRARALDSLAVDNCFAQWTGSAELVWPDRGWSLALAADPLFGHLVVYTAPAKDSIAIEPVSHANNAVNLADRYDDTGLRVLQPGETMTGAMTLTPRPLENTDAG